MCTLVRAVVLELAETLEVEKKMDTDDQKRKRRNESTLLQEISLKYRPVTRC